MSRHRRIARALVVVCIVAAIAWGLGHRGRFELAALDAWLSGLGAWAPLAHVALFAVATVLFLPAIPFSLAGGAMFGPFWGTLLNLLGAIIGASIAFLVARYVTSGWIARRSAGRLTALVAGVEAEGWRFVAFVRLVPLFPFNLTNYALGLTRIGFAVYALTSLLSMIPGAAACTWLGHAGREALSGDRDAVLYALLALGMLATIILLPRLVRRRPRDPGDWVEPEALSRELDSGADGILVDVRSAEEFTGDLGHVPGAINIPLAALPAQMDSLQQRRGGAITVICRTDKRSAAAQKSMQAAGLSGVRALRGGMERWNALGFATSRDDAEVEWKGTAENRP